MVDTITGLDSGNIKYACFYDGWHFFDENKEQVFYPEDWPDHLEFAKPKTLEEMGIEIASPEFLTT